LCLRVLQLLAEERKRRKVTKYALSQRSGVSPQMIGYIENGERNPTLEVVCRLATALEVDLSKLLQKAEADTPRSKAE
jgi:transcriptional regulator with XRE-family HTH domain